MRVSVVEGRDKEMAEWAAAHLNAGEFQQPYRAFGFIDGHGRLFAVSVLNDHFPGGNIEWTHYGPGRITMSMCAFLLDFVFNRLHVSRVTAKTKRANTLVNKLLLRYGWKFEGVQKRYFGPEKDDDAMVYFMLREQAERYLN